MQQFPVMKSDDGEEYDHGAEARVLSARFTRRWKRRSSTGVRAFARRVLLEEAHLCRSPAVLFCNLADREREDEGCGVRETGAIQDRALAPADTNRTRVGLRHGTRHIARENELGLMTKILLVDDSKFLRLATERALARAGYEVSAAIDGEHRCRWLGRPGRT